LSESRESLALAKFACPACGGEATWNPARQRLVCPFCGTESPATLDATGAIVEHDLVAALRGLGDAARGWQTERRQVKCQSCNAISVLDPSRQAQNCEFCGSAQLVPYEEAKEAFRPESVLPFKVSEAAARDRIRAWYGKLWLAPSALKKKALTDTVRGIYLPYWTFDARVDAEWTAEAGHYYYTTETYEQNGRVQTRQVQHIRWEPAAGRFQQVFDDDLVCASVGIHANLLRGIEPFPTGELKPYDAAFVAGWDCRTLPDRPHRRRTARTRGDGREAARRRRATGTRRYVSQSRCAVPLFGADLQAHSRAGLVSLVHVWRARVPVRDERGDQRHKRRVPEEPVESGASHRRNRDPGHHRPLNGRAIVSARRVRRLAVLR
jgi:Zn finger protein HypA/HybF involved in hydrogenase expression